MVDGVLFRPLPFRDADRLASVFMRFVPQNMARGPLSMADYLEVRAASASTFEELAAYSNNRLDVTGGEAPEQVIGISTTPSLFKVLGARPLIGRTFLPDEDKPDGSRVMILSEAFWRRRFNADPGIAGRAITADGTVYTIVGVMPASFSYPRADGRILDQHVDGAADTAGPVHV